MSDTVEWALKAARAGWHVFPCAGLSEDDPGTQKRPVKTPHGRLEWGQYATADARVIRDWWTNRCPDATAVGVACKPSRLLVVDLDMWKPGKVIPDRFQLAEGSNGEDVFAAIVESLGVPYPFGTFAVSTPTGGTHLYFKDPGAPLRNSSLVTGFVDIRASGGQHGGYVLSPGSVTSAGTYEVLFRNPVLAAPDWLLALCAPPKAAAPRAPGPRYQGEAKMDGVLAIMAAKGEGGRNDCLMWAACCFAKDGIPIDECIRDLGQAARDAGLEDSEIIPTIRSGYRKVGR